MDTRLVSIKEASKKFNFPLQKLYRAVEERKVPFIEIENLSGTKSKKINTKTFAEWLDKLSEENGTI
jgi:hypothetical protein